MRPPQRGQEYPRVPECPGRDRQGPPVGAYVAMQFGRRRCQRRGGKSQLMSTFYVLAARQKSLKLSPGPNSRSGAALYARPAWRRAEEGDNGEVRDRAAHAAAGMGGGG